jgi:hypothetical protein
MPFVRRFSVAIAAGAISGLVVGGIGGRFAMFVLAQLNPEATGVRSDDDFVIGQFTLSGTLNLLSVATVIGTVGGLIYFTVRSLRLGPTWFRYASVALGAGVTVGAMIVHDGVDFTVLQPAGLAIALFVAIPAAYAVLLQWLTERWSGPQQPARWEPLLWVGRLVLTVIFGVALVDLVGDIDTFA